MTVVRIRERAGEHDDANTVVSFDYGEEYPVSIADPFSEAEEARLEWYFEGWLRFPFTNQVHAREAAQSITTYGEVLFKQLFADPDAYASYKSSDLDELSFEIVGSPEFQRLHWEALKDPALPQPLSLRVPMVRKYVKSKAAQAKGQASPTINLLIVTARPFGTQDVGYRTISRPLVERLEQAEVHVDVDILRPGTYKTLARHLENMQDRYGTGYYHIIHFDVHGAVLTYEDLQSESKADRILFQSRYGRQDIEPFEGRKAFLFLEAEQLEQAEPVEAGELAELLINHEVPVVVLNACQSGKHTKKGKKDKEDKKVEATEASLGSRLMQAGVQLVVAMGYSVTVSAAERLMKTLYQQLFEGKPLSTAIRRARLELYNDKGRRAYYNQTIDLEDWLLPIVYVNRDYTVPLRAPTKEERSAWYERIAGRYPPPKTAYGFVGRDLDVLQIVRRVLKHNLLLIRGMGGAGKTTLLKHLGNWWQTTDFIDRVLYFGYDEKAWTCLQILDVIARQLLDQIEYLSDYQPLSPAAQRALVVERLKGQPHLLILDNLESITGSHLAIPNTLPPEEQNALTDFLAVLAGGKTRVLLGSRGDETWLAKDTFHDNVYGLSGLDPEAASDLGERVLERHGATQYRENEDLQKLLTLLDGYPMPIEVVLGNLARQTPRQVLEGLQAGDVELDTGDIIVRCIDYSHSNLSTEAQGLLSCLAPFTGVFNTLGLKDYTEKLKQQPPLARLPYDRWDTILKEAQNWGLVNPQQDISALLHLQPIFPYFLRTRLQDQPEVRGAIETAYREYYSEYARKLNDLMKSRKPEEKQGGQWLAGIEYENLFNALQFALNAQESILLPFLVLSGYLDTRHDEERGLTLGKAVLQGLEGYSAEKLSGQLGGELASVVGTIAQRQTNLKLYEAAKASYQKALKLFRTNKTLEPSVIRKMSATIYHSLGWVAQEQRQWLQAEHNYQQALEIYVEFNMRYELAKIYHNLGGIAQEQRQWEQVEQYRQKALEIYVELNARYDQAKIYNDLGVAAQAKNQWQQAAQYFQKALEIFGEFNEHYDQAKMYHNLGVAAQKQRQWLQAEHNYQQALEIFVELNTRYEQAHSYHTLGSMAQVQHQWQQAEQYFQKALEIKIELNAHYDQADTYHMLGLVAEAQRQWTQAQDYFLEDLKICVEYDDEDRSLTALHSLARLWQESDDDGLPEAIAAVLGVSPTEVEELLRKSTDES